MSEEKSLTSLTEEVAGIFQLSLFPPEKCRHFIEKANSLNGWESARVHGGHDDGDVQWVVSSEVRQAAMISLSSLPSVFEQFDATIRRRIIPLVNEAWRLHLQEHGGAQIIRYHPGGHYVAHTDTGPDLDDRQFSVVCYLNDDFSGGVTNFPSLNYSVTPRCGKAVVFPSEYLHRAEPVVRGSKYVLVSWLIGQAPVSWI